MKHIVREYRCDTKLGGKNRKGERAVIIGEFGRRIQVQFDDGKTFIVDRMSCHAPKPAPQNV